MRSGFRMNQVTLEMRNFARDLIDHETSIRRPSQIKPRTAFYVVEMFRPPLANLMGLGGFRALLSRALVLAAAEVSWLGAVRVKADGDFEGLEDPDAQLDAAELLEGRVILLAQLLGLLVALIGANLTSRVVNEIWPKFNSTLRVSADTEEPSGKRN
jgi:hypothetical protein